MNQPERVATCVVRLDREAYDVALDAARRTGSTVASVVGLAVKQFWADADAKVTAPTIVS